MEVTIMESDIDEARAFIRRIEKKRLYQACRAYLPSLLLKTYPHIYKLLMSELGEKYGGSLDKKVEERLRFVSSITDVAALSRRIKGYEAARRKQRRIDIREHPEAFSKGGSHEQRRSY
jgi:hypothetical protein